MTNTEWLKYAITNEDKLTNLIRDWHPRLRANEIGDMTITAVNAEKACEVIRHQIKTKDANKPNPVIEFKDALTNGNIQVINRLLNDAWFGVPESRSCWDIIGFKEAVWLIEDPPNVD